MQFLTLYALAAPLGPAALHLDLWRVGRLVGDGPPFPEDGDPHRNLRRLWGAYWLDLYRSNRLTFNLAAVAAWPVAVLLYAKFLVRTVTERARA